MLGLGSNIAKGATGAKGIVTDNLMLRHGYTREPVQPVSTGAVYVSGTNDHVDTGNHFSSTFSSNFSIAMWIKPFDGQPSSEQTIMGSLLSDTDGIRVDLLTSGALRFVLVADGASNNATVNVASTTFVTDGPGEWTHVAVTALQQGGDDTIIKLYVNGVDQTSTSSSIASANHDDFASTLTLYLGGRNTAGTANRFFKGYICNAGIWGAVLTQPQVKSIMHKDYAALSTSEKSDANLISFWELSSSNVDIHGTNNATLS